MGQNELGSRKKDRCGTIEPMEGTRYFVGYPMPHWARGLAVKYVYALNRQFEEDDYGVIEHIVWTVQTA